MADDKAKNVALDGAIAQIEKDYGKGSIMRLGNQRRACPRQRDSHRLHLP